VLDKEGVMSKAVSTAENIYLDAEVEGDLQNRLSRIEGHIRGVKRMLSEHASCEDLLLQLSAVRSALNQATGRLLENHMETCVANCVRAGHGEKALSKLKGALTHVIKNL
jgi:CsoR family transcriptional regulator, copper-sensing transcriptional repressor